MSLYILYRVGLFLTSIMPKRAAYAMATAFADIFCAVSRKDRLAVAENLSVVMGRPVDRRDISATTRGVFRNFAKYLIDFFRAKEIDKNYIAKNVRVEGQFNIDDARAMGKGVILLSAHLGNWELGAAVTSLLGYPISAVVLTHQNKRINDFFTSQRLMSDVKPIEMGVSLKACYRALRNNECLALLGDRDFTKNGLPVDFFGRQALMPKGPAVFSYRLGSPIVPVFMVREPDDTYKFYMEKPIISTPGLDEEAAVKDLTVKCSHVIEAYVRKYPAQWFVFRNIWDSNE